MILRETLPLNRFLGVLPDQRSELQSTLSCRIRKCADPTVIPVSIPIEDDGVHTGAQCTFSETSADFLRSGRIAGCDGLARPLLIRGCRRERAARQVVDQLSIDMLRTAKDRQPGLGRHTEDALPDAPFPTRATITYALQDTHAARLLSSASRGD